MAGIVSVLFPLLLITFVPVFQDFYDTGRWVVLMLLTLALISRSGIELIKTKKLYTGISPVSMGFGALAIASLISLFFASTNTIEALTHPLGAITYICLFFITLLLPRVLSKEQKDRMIWAILIIIGCIGLVVIYQQFAITSLVFPNAAFLKSNLWNPTGTPISAVLLFALGIPLAIQNIRLSFTRHKEKLAALGIVSGVFMLAGLIITLWRFIPMIPTVVMPISIGWATLLEALKSGKTALVGVGAENFLSAYAAGRPIAINNTLLWNTGFSTSATLLLHTITTLGLTGGVAMVFLLVGWLRSMPKTRAIQIVWILASIAIIFFPPSIPLLLFMALVAAAYEPVHDTPKKIHTFLALGIFFVVLGTVVVSLIGLFRFTKGEILYAQAGIAVETENNLTKAYTDHVLAIKQNTYMTRYHVSLSQLALVMGGSILAQAPKNETTGEVTLLDEDKSLVKSLFSLAVSEAKLATTLAPTNYVSWTNLATVYQSLIGVATDAGTWTIAAYQKAITLNPISPNLRIDFGGMYMDAKNYDAAISQFQAAITLKPNYANAYYNLANAYKTKGNTQFALEALIRTKDLIPKNGTEYMKVQEEITALQTEGVPVTKTPSVTPKPQTTPVPTTIPLIP